MEYINQLTDYFLIFNARELAAILWFVVCGVWLLSDGKIRPHIINVAKAAGNRKILISIIGTVVYTGLAVLFISKIWAWNIVIAKEAVYWLFGTALVLLFNINKANQGNFFKGILVDSVKLILVLELMVNSYVFNLWVELVLLPFILTVAIMAEIAKNREEYLPVKRIMDFILSFVGIALIMYALSNIASDYQGFLTIENLYSLSLPATLTFAYIPILYLIALYAAYDDLFMRIEHFGRHDVKRIKSAKRKLLYSCHFNLGKLNKVSITN